MVFFRIKYKNLNYQGEDMLKIGPFSIEKSYLKAGAIVAAAAALVYLFYK